MPWHVGCETVRRVSGSTQSLASPPSFSSTIQLQVYVLRISSYFLLRPQINFWLSGKYHDPALLVGQNNVTPPNAEAEVTPLLVKAIVRFYKELRQSLVN